MKPLYTLIRRVRYRAFLSGLSAARRTVVFAADSAGTRPVSQAGPVSKVRGKSFLREHSRSLNAGGPPLHDQFEGSPKEYVLSPHVATHSRTAEDAATARRASSDNDDFLASVGWY